jgi:hypothetical protein
MFWHHDRSARLSRRQQSSRRLQSRRRPHRMMRARRLWLEGLEGRRQLATLTVTGTVGNHAI